MTEGPGAKGPPRPLNEVELAAIEAYLPQLRRSVAGQRFLYWSLGIGFVVGLAAHVGGYLLRSSATTEPLGLAADLLYALGYTLWTGVVLVVFVQVVPEENGVRSCGGLMPTRQRCAIRLEPEATRRGDDQAPTASGQADQPLA
jgi:hypothetical protein